MIYHHPHPNPPSLATHEFTQGLCTTMSTRNQTTHLSASTSNFTSIFDSAVDEYKRLTKKDLHTHPFAAVFDACKSPNTILDVFRKQAQDFDRFRKGNEKLMKWLNPTVHILFTLSATLGEGIGLVSQPFILFNNASAYVSQPFSPAKTIFTGTSVLLGVSLFPHIFFALRHSQTRRQGITSRVMMRLSISSSGFNYSSNV